jgi:hypothetical protein
LLVVEWAEDPPTGTAAEADSSALLPAIEWAAELPVSCAEVTGVGGLLALEWVENASTGKPLEAAIATPLPAIEWATAAPTGRFAKVGIRMAAELAERAAPVFSFSDV